MQPNLSPPFLVSVSPGFYSSCLYCFSLGSFCCQTWQVSKFSHPTFPAAGEPQPLVFWGFFGCFVGVFLGRAAPAVWKGCQPTLPTLWEFRNTSLIKTVVVFVLPGSFPFILTHNDFASLLQEASVGGNSE